MAAGLLALPFGTAHAAETPVYDTSQAALAQSQLRDVTGRVTDRATGDPIVGVTVAQQLDRFRNGDRCRPEPSPYRQPRDSC